MARLTVHFVFFLLYTSTEEKAPHSPRMTFTDQETAVKRIHLPTSDEPIGLFLDTDSDKVTVVGHKTMTSFSFHTIHTSEPRLLREQCFSRHRDFNITVVHKTMTKGHVFMCGTNGKRTICCDKDLSEQSPRCRFSPVMFFAIKEGEPSVLVESKEQTDLYVTNSGSHQHVGLHRPGKDRLGPANQDKEQHYVGLVLCRQEETQPSQDSIYGFYNERNDKSEVALYDQISQPFVTRVCLVDKGGPKQILQFIWTSQINARLFCGDTDSRQHFSELVDVFTVHAEQWKDSRVYALFRNEWSMSAVCVYTFKDIDQVFMNSPFKHNKRTGLRKCVQDSTQIPIDDLKKIKEDSEMKDAVRPLTYPTPLIFKHHSYTHIFVDSSHVKNDSQHVVLFLTLNQGGIHKVLINQNHTFVIAEYQPFQHRTHILNILLHPVSRKLYVNSRSEVVQLEVVNCAHYGETCEDCILARDPYCGWNGTHCTPATKDTKQDVAQGNHTICNREARTLQQVSTPVNRDTEKAVDLSIGLHSRYFLSCPVTSHHANYTWYHPKGATSCSPEQQPCLWLIDSMSPEYEGTYKCMSEEGGHSKTLKLYQLRSSVSGHPSSLLLCLFLMSVLIIEFGLLDSYQTQP